MRILFLILLSSIFFNDAFAQYKRYKWGNTTFEKVESLIDACHRKEYANCYQLAEIYLSEKSKKKKILSQHTEQRVFDLLEIEDEKKLEKIKKAYVAEKRSKDKKKVERRIIRSKAMPRIGQRLLYLSCLNEQPESCIRISDFCTKDDNQKMCKFRAKICNESTMACQIISEHEDRTQSDTIFWGAILMMGLASFIISRSVFQDEEEFQAGEKLEDGSGKKDSAANAGAILKYSRPFFKRYVSPIVSGMKNKKKIKDKYKRVLASAGLTQVLTPEDFFSFKLFLILGFPITFVGMREFMETDWPMEIIPLIAIFGFYYPDIWIRGAISQRQEEVLSGMPFCVDMLALSVEAGLDFVAAMTKVIEKAPPSALSQEFEILIKEIKVGASRAEALRNMAWRIDLIQVSSFTATLIAADSVGASVGPILKALGNEIRQKRSSDIEKQGATAATKILIPMIFFIVPAVLCIIMGPVAVDYLANQ
jgi:tight adherence protein C